MNITALIIGFIILCIYIYPTTIAITEKKNNLFLIMFINGAFGWTIIGWIIALIIAKKSAKGEDSERMKKFKEMNTWSYWLKK